MPGFGAARWTIQAGCGLQGTYGQPWVMVPEGDEVFEGPLACGPVGRELFRNKTGSHWFDCGPSTAREPRDFQMNLIASSLLSG
jgi:hypothetical protein